MSCSLMYETFLLLLICPLICSLYYITLSQGSRLRTGKRFSLMRFIVSAKIPTEAGNRMIKDPKFVEKLDKYIKEVKAEASYFFEADGDRVAVFIVDMQTPDQIPALAEPLFQWMGAKVEFHPVMSFEDLKKSKPKTIIDTYA
jgi:hypothetical protein